MRAIILGVDGGYWSFIKEHLDNLSSFAYVLERGTHGILKSTIPPLTPPAWTSIATGVNPGKHGVFSFYDLRSYGKRLISSRDRACKAIWNLLSLWGRRVLCLWVPLTYPPEPVNGLMLSGFITPSNTDRYVFPMELMGKMDKLGARQVYKTVEKSSDLLDSLRTRKKIARKLLEEVSWDLAFIVFRETDEVWHVSYGYNERDALRVYKEVDDFIAYILDEIIDDEETYLFLVSDHGFGYMPSKIFFINRWLEIKGFLKRRKSGFLDATLTAIATSNRLSRILSLGLKLLPAWLINNTHRAVGGEPGEQINPNGTVAYALQWTGMPYALIIMSPALLRNPSQYFSLRERIVREFLGIKGPDGKRVFLRAYRNEELYQGPHAWRGPDIVMELSPDYLAAEGWSPLFVFADNLIRQNEHHPDGIFACLGPHVKDGNFIGEMATWDVAPTILHTLEMAVPKYMDGAVRVDIFKEGSKPRVRKPLLKNVSMARLTPRLRLKKHMARASD